MHNRPVATWRSYLVQVKFGSGLFSVLRRRFLQYAWELQWCPTRWDQQCTANTAQQFNNSTTTSHRSSHAHAIAPPHLRSFFGILKFVTHWFHTRNTYTHKHTWLTHTLHTHASSESPYPTPSSSLFVLRGESKYDKFSFRCHNEFWVW